MILPLETFRGIFALIIVLHHLKIETFIQKSNLIINGGLVVDFFFVLSGFVISLNYIDKINSKSDLINSQKRFLRLYPLLLTLFVFILIEVIKLIVENYTNLRSTYAPFSGFNNYYSLVANFSTTWMVGWSFNLPSWSISTEFYTYLIFAIAVLNAKNKLYIFILFIILSLILFIINNLGYKNLDNFVYPARCIYSFFLGTLTFLIYKKYKQNFSQFICLVLIIFSFLFINYSDSLSLNNKYIFAPLLFSLTVLFVSCLNHNSVLYKILSNKYTVYLGAISYGVYMIHFGLVWFFRQFCRFALNISEIDDYLVFDNYFGEILTLIFIIIIIYLSHLSLKYFERRFR